MSEIKTVGVLGCGLMGAGIVEVSAKAGYKTLVREVNKTVLARGLERIDNSMNRAVERGKLSVDDKNTIAERITGTTQIEDLAECDVIIEAVSENLDIKRVVWEEVAEVRRPGTLIATNTSSIPLTKVAPQTGDPENFLGLHFMNPVPVMRLVEIVRSVATSEAAYERGKAFIESLGKETITAKDTPGFVINALLVPYLCSAVAMVESGVASAEDIDKGMKGGCNMPMGPITLLDFVGLDTTLAIAEVLHEEFGDPRYAPPPLLRRMVELGRMGKKSGRGFYDYSK